MCEADSSAGSGRLASSGFGLLNNPDTVSCEQEGVSGSKPDYAGPDHYDVTCLCFDPLNTRQRDQRSYQCRVGRKRPAVVREQIPACPFMPTNGWDATLNP